METIRKIKARELAEHLLGGLIVGERGLYWIVEKSEISDGFFKADPGLETANCSTNAFWQRSGAYFLILDILHLPAGPQIVTLIIETVAVPMIDDARSYASNKSVHKYTLPPAVPSSPPEITVMLRVYQAARKAKNVPRQLGDLRIINVVDQCHVAAGQRNLTHV